MSHTLAFFDFFELVDRSLTDPRAHEELQRRYQLDAATLILDFSGLAHRSGERGLIYALARAREAMRAIEPALQAHGGQRIKQIADGMCLAFPTPQQALLAALDAQLHTAQLSRSADDDPSRVGIGLGWGAGFLIPRVDLIGEEVNRASALGKEGAKGGEILMTEAFTAALPSIPVGVGVQTANSDRAHRVGFYFHEARDYRD